MQKTLHVFASSCCSPHFSGFKLPVLEYYRSRTPSTRVHACSIMNSSSSSSIHTPLSHVLPWKEHETVLITDSVESDGRFVLCTLAAAASSKQANVLWLCCTAMTDKLTLAALKKIGFDKAAAASAYLSEQGHLQREKSSRLTIRSIPTLFSRSLNQADCDSFQEEAFVKDFYRQVVAWLLSCDTSDDSWVILDDVSALSLLLGERLVYGLVLSLLGFKSRHQFGLAVRCSNDSDVESAGLIAAQRADYFGAGGDDNSSGRNLHSTLVHSLVELADTVVDVLPLASGYTREAHGRIIFTGKSKARTAAFNFCLTDHQVLAIRMA